jgi:NADH:ubiquinone oxidoreductase subunit 6 (subunit J)
MNSVVFIVIAILTLAAALAAATLPKLVHAALSFALSFVGVALFYFLLGAEFVGLVQVFVYVGAVAVLIVFTILLTRRGAEEEHGFHWSGALIGLAVFAGLTWAILRSSGLSAPLRRSRRYRQANRRIAHDGLRLAVAVRRTHSDGGVSRRDGACDGGKTVTITLQLFLLVSAALFCIGLLAALSRRHAIFILIGIEMMLAAAGLNFIAFWRFGPQPARRRE